MNSNIQMLPIIFVIISCVSMPVLAMDEPFHCKVPLQDITTHPNQKQEKATKLTQAQLDAIQFVKEQETKKLIAARNKQPNNQHQKISCGLKELLKDQIIKGEQFNNLLIDRIPADVQKEILKFAYPAVGYNNGYQLLPALIPHCPRDFYSPAPWENFYKKEYAKKYKRCFEIELRAPGARDIVDCLFNVHEYERDFLIDYVKIDYDNAPIYDRHDYHLNFFAKRGILSCRFRATITNDTLYLSKSSMKDLLENCSLEQLNLIRALWLRNEEIVANWHIKEFSKWYNQPILLNAQETKTYLSLPEQLRISLETNYKIKLHSPWAKQTLAFLSGCGLVAGYMASTLWKKA